MTRRVMVFASLLLSMALVVPLEAQRGPPMGRRGEGQGQRQDRAQLERRIRAQMGEMMRQRLGLSEAESQSLGEIVEEFEPARRGIAREEQAVRRRVEALTADEAATDGEASDLLARLADVRRRDAELFAEEQERLLEILTPLQVLRFHSLREQLGERIQRLRGQRGRGNSEGGAGRNPGWADGLVHTPAEGGMYGKPYSVRPGASFSER
jgi:Spy/CpxP family protein refolding chaperone